MSVMLGQTLFAASCLFCSGLQKAWGIGRHYTLLSNCGHRRLLFGRQFRENRNPLCPILPLPPKYIRKQTRLSLLPQGKQVYDDEWSREAPAHTPISWGSSKPTPTLTSLQDSEYSLVNFHFFSTVTISLPISPQYFNKNSGNFRGERTSSSVQCLPSPFYRWGN